MMLKRAHKKSEFRLGYLNSLYHIILQLALPVEVQWVYSQLLNLKHPIYDRFKIQNNCELSMKLT